MKRYLVTVLASLLAVGAYGQQAVPNQSRVKQPTVEEQIEEARNKELARQEAESYFFSAEGYINAAELRTAKAKAFRESANEKANLIILEGTTTNLLEYSAVAVLKKSAGGLEKIAGDNTRKAQSLIVLADQLCEKYSLSKRANMPVIKKEITYWECIGRANEDFIDAVLYYEKAEDKLGHAGMLEMFAIEDEKTARWYKTMRK
ncbi:MAG: hypothetical protein WCI72_01445 [archaeon]